MNFEKLPEAEDPPRPVVSPRRLRRGVWLLVLALAAGAAGVIHHQRRQEAGDAAMAAQAAALREKELQLAELSAAAARLAADPPAQLGLIEQGLATVQEIMRLRPRPEPKDARRLFEWQARRDEARAAEASRESKRLEDEASERLRAGDRAGAIERTKQAWRLQREINGSSASQTYKNYGRETRLAGEAERLETEPLGMEVAAALTEAERASGEGRWGEALAAYSRAREAQAQLNRDHPRSRYADTEGLARLNREISALAAAEPMRHLEQALAAARAEGTDREAALRHYREALEWQQRINTSHAQSRFASPEKLAELERQIQSLEAAAAWAGLVEDDRRLAAHLARREIFQAQELAARAVRTLELAAKRWPAAQGLPEELRLRLTFLALRTADLAPVQDQVHRSLRAIPGRNGASLFTREVGQGLFRLVMNSNPSRSVDPERAVDSVTLEEAEEFCRRLGWIMGRPVRLPTREEYAAVLASDNAALWAGLRDGLAEWVGGDAGRLVLGGGGDLPGAAMPDGLFWKLSEPRRSPLVGFRFVMETGR